MYFSPSPPPPPPADALRCVRIDSLAAALAKLNVEIPMEDLLASGKTLSTGRSKSALTPPGSPPSPSAHAVPNDHGNSNGNIPADPLHPSQPTPSFFCRAIGALLPQHYRDTIVPTSNSSRLIGGGRDNDGVFANVMAKPQPQRIVTAENGDVYLAPEDFQRD